MGSFSLSFKRPALVAAMLLVISIPLVRAHAQTATNLVVDGVSGDVDQNEVDTFISFMTNAGGINPNAAFPTNALGDNLAYGTPGLNLEAINYMYRITGDLMVSNPSMATEHMQLMNLAIAWSESFMLLRNDQANGNQIVMWTGNVDHVWQTYATGTAQAGYAGSENGDTAGHILYTALNILQTPSIWNLTVPDGNPHNFGVTYLQRAQTYINMMEDTTQNYFTKYFVNPTTYQIVPPTSPAWTVLGENMDAWNRQFLLTNDYLRLAQCHAILGDNPTLQAFYTNIVKTSANAYVANAIPATATQTVSSAYPNGEAVYDSGYGNEGDIEGQITGNSSSHTSYEFQGLARAFEAGPAYTSASLMNMERYANTVEYAMFNYTGYPTPSSYPPFNVPLATPYVTAYYKTIDAGLVLPTKNATSDYLYGQFYFMTPYNTLFWQPAANGAAPMNHNNYHNNPYYTTGILYAKHWVATHPQTMISVASNTATAPSAGVATYAITTNSTAAVTLSIPDLPAGTTASFSPATVPAGSGSATLTVQTSSSTPNGSSLFSLTGTSGGSVQTLGLTLIAASPDFTVSVSGTSTVAAGANGTFTVTVKALNGFGGDVTLSADPVFALPGVTVSFNPSVISGGSGTSVVTATTSSTVPTTGGVWTEGFIGTSGSIEHESYSGLTVKNVPQTISFPSIANQTYGAGPIPLPLATSQNNVITYKATGPETITGGETLAGQSLNITGVGMISVTASSPATSYATAATPVVQSFTVSPAMLSVTAQNQTMVYSTALPVLTSTTSGFVNGDSAAVVTGAPVLATTAVSTSPAGTYPISVSAGTLAAANYAFSFINGTLTISPASAAISLGGLAQTYTGAPLTVTATTIPAGLPVSITYNGSSVVPTAAGSYAVVATISNPNYAGTTSATLVISKATAAVTVSATPTSTTAGQSVTITGTVASSAAGQPTGSLTFLNGSTVLGTVPVTAGVAVFTSSSLPGGMYALNAVYSGDSNFVGAKASSALTISDYTLAASPSTLTILDGQSATTTLTITPIANYKGAVAMSCGTLPSNVICKFSTTTPPLDGTGTPENVILSISTNGASGALASVDRHADSRVALASVLSLPALLGGFLLLLAGGHSGRRKLQGLLLVVVSIAFTGLTACGSATTANLATKGTDAVVVTGSGAVPLSHNLNLTVTIQ
ncbi:Ig-like domain (group 3) [Bryocella elongata]|uniref:Ig-like domain (Group 3) n=1 Tax=Bryocella elongata TaxID=863522 RepID=A0A1H5UPM9_9BACT|nr:MBG domain-containing protein [Bryocella elongata]SEF77032.1 Ig-like domain (group 3) [Bryocella elongata]